VAGARNCSAGGRTWASGDCLARGRSGPSADGAVLAAADRREPDAYVALTSRTWHAVGEVMWQPAMVRGALAALHQQARHWTYVSSGNVYASNATPGADGTAQVLQATDRDEVDVSSMAKPRSPASRRPATPSETDCWWPGLV